MSVYGFEDKLPEIDQVSLISVTEMLRFRVVSIPLVLSSTALSWIS